MEQCNARGIGELNDLRAPLSSCSGIRDIMGLAMLCSRLISFHRGAVLHIVEPFRSDVNPELVL